MRLEFQNKTSPLRNHPYIFQSLSPWNMEESTKTSSTPTDSNYPCLQICEIPLMLIPRLTRSLQFCLSSRKLQAPSVIFRCFCAMALKFPTNSCLEMECGKKHDTSLFFRGHLFGSLQLAKKLSLLDTIQSTNIFNLLKWKLTKSDLLFGGFLKLLFYSHNFEHTSTFRTRIQ